MYIAGVRKPVCGETLGGSRGSSLLFPAARGAGIGCPVAQVALAGGQIPAVRYRRRIVMLCQGGVRGASAMKRYQLESRDGPDRPEQFALLVKPGQYYADRDRM